MILIFVKHKTPDFHFWQQDNGFLKRNFISDLKKIFAVTIM